MLAWPFSYIKWNVELVYYSPESTEPVELSVFDIKDHPDYKFRCGSTVLRVGGFEVTAQHSVL